MSEHIALATAVYEGVKPKAFRAIQRMSIRIGQSFGTVWVISPQRDRLTYPFCVSGYIYALFAREEAEGCRADWLLWLEDDVVPPADLYEKLRAAADPLHKPYVCALAYCNSPPYWPGVADIEGNRRIQWQEAPAEGTHAVDSVGMCAALFHRSVFDRVKEPWFGVLPPRENSGIGPDAYWCYRLKEHGIQPYVCCDAEVGHVGTGPVITRELSERWNAQQH